MCVKEDEILFVNEIYCHLPKETNTLFTVSNLKLSNLIFFLQGSIKILLDTCNCNTILMATHTKAFWGVSLIWEHRVFVYDPNQQLLIWHLEL